MYGLIYVYYQNQKCVERTRLRVKLTICMKNMVSKCVQHAKLYIVNGSD